MTILQSRFAAILLAAAFAAPLTAAEPADLARWKQQAAQSTIGSESFAT